MATFKPPTVNRKYSSDPLIGRINYPLGLTILKNGSSYTQHENPSDEEIAAADIAYLGGRVYTIGGAEVTALTNAGYGAYIT